MNALGSPDHDVPAKPPEELKLEALEPISDASKDKALQEWVGKNGF